MLRRRLPARLLGFRSRDSRPRFFLHHDADTFLGGRSRLGSVACQEHGQDDAHYQPRNQRYCALLNFHSQALNCCQVRKSRTYFDPKHPVEVNPLLKPVQAHRWQALCLYIVCHCLVGFFADEDLPRLGVSFDAFG